MTSCSHCGYPVEQEATVCPHCGTGLVAVWPPPPEGFDAPTLPPPLKTLTGRVWTDMLLGGVGQYLIHFGIARSISPVPTTDEVSIGASMIMEFFCALMFGALGYFTLWKWCPWVARGSGYVSLVLFVVILGGLFTCRALPF